MPSNKILTVFIVCLGIVTSIWLFQRVPKAKSVVVKSTDKNTVETYKYIESTTTDWKNILTSIDPKTQNTVEDLTKKNESVFDETTLTARIARDSFSQYLLAVKNGKTIDSTEAEKIAKNTLSTPEYNKTSGPVYVAINLHIIQKNDADTLKKYKEAVNLSLKNRSSQIKDNPVTVLDDAIKTNNNTTLLKIDPVIVVGKGFVSDFLNMEVPSDAVTLHLAILNSLSNILFDVEAMRVVFDDPVRALNGISRYNKDLLNFQNSLININNFLEQKTNS